MSDYIFFLRLKHKLYILQLLHFTEDFAYFLIYYLILKVMLVEN